MSITSPVEILMQEHRVIETVLDAMEDRLADLSSVPFPLEFFQRALEFFSQFADGCHHYKEEDGLFPALAARGMPANSGPIGVMLHEHNIGRSCLQGIRANLNAAKDGSGEAIAAVRGFAAAYVEMLRQHIAKEDNILFQMAARMLDDGDNERLLEQFNDETNPKIAPELRRRFKAIVHELAAVPAAG